MILKVNILLFSVLCGRYVVSRHGCWTKIDNKVSGQCLALSSAKLFVFAEDCMILNTRTENG